MKKSLFIALFAVFASCTAFAQTKTNLYNDKGTQIAIVTKNFSTTLTCAKTGQLFNGTVLLGTWMQSGSAVGDIPFVLSIGKNEVVNRNVGLMVYIGTYNEVTGACKLNRLAADANNGIAGTCTITVNK